MTNFTQLPFDEQSAQVKPTERHIFTVAELTATVRTMLESNYSQIWVQGEISNARLWKTGHFYFTLKDAEAQLHAVMFRSAFQALRFKPADGQQVLARGKLSVYERRGEYQIVCDHLDPTGRGALHLAYEQLKDKLH